MKRIKKSMIKRKKMNIMKRKIQKRFSTSVVLRNKANNKKNYKQRNVNGNIK